MTDPLAVEEVGWTYLWYISSITILCNVDCISEIAKHSNIPPFSVHVNLCILWDSQSQEESTQGSESISMPQEPELSPPRANNCSSNNSALSFSTCNRGTVQQQPKRIPTTPKFALEKAYEVEKELLQTENFEPDIVKQNLEIQTQILECLQPLLKSAMFVFKSLY